MTQLTVSLLQTDLFWRQPQKNRDAIEQKIKHIDGATDLIVLPEVFTSGFAVGSSWTQAELEDLEQTLIWMRSIAKNLDCAITGSTVWLSDGQVRNRMFFITPNEECFYDKCHLFRMAGEHERYAPGNQRVIVNYRQYRILLTVCYDLRFPVFCRNQEDYDFMICVANWPVERHQAWQTLLQARAIENQAYVVGVNRVGKDGKNLCYEGGSCIVDFEGNHQLEFGLGEPGLKTGELSLEKLGEFRRNFPVWQDRDEFILKRPLANSR